MHVNDASELICIKWYFIMVRFSCMYLQVNAIVITDALDLVSFYLFFLVEEKPLKLFSECINKNRKKSNYILELCRNLIFILLLQN